MHVFTLLGDPVRLRIVEILASGEHSAGLLCDAVGREFSVSRATVGYHLRILRDADFVRVNVEENRRLYRLKFNALDSVDRALIDLYELWDRRYDWPYRTDPAASPPRRHRLADRAREWSPVTQAEIEPLAPDEDIYPFDSWEDEEV